MAVKQTGRKTYTSMQGKSVDMDLLRQKNELTPAVGNARVNARGDELGPGGQIIKKREDVLSDFYRDNPQNTVEDEVPVKKNIDSAGKDVTDDWEEPAPVAKAPVAKKAAVTKQPVVETTDEWEEDDEGNFVKRGE